MYALVWLLKVQRSHENETPHIDYRCCTLTFRGDRGWESALNGWRRRWVHSRGNAQAAKGDFTAAIKSFSDAIAANPQSASAYVSRGWAYGKTAEYERAIADYTSAIALDAKNVDAYKKRTAHTL